MTLEKPFNSYVVWDDMLKQRHGEQGHLPRHSSEPVESHLRHLSDPHLHPVSPHRPQPQFAGQLRCAAASPATSLSHTMFKLNVLESQLPYKTVD